MGNLDNVDFITLQNLSEVDLLSDRVFYFDGFKKQFMTFASLLNFPITVVFEKDYVDRDFRDSYYHFFASKHFQVPKDCQRLTLFEGLYSCYDFYDKDKIPLLKNSIIGSIVVRPLNSGAWGKTLIDPKKINQRAFYVRTTEYHHLVNGVDFSINAYPFSSQDCEMMSCAETSIWTILNYYGTRYSEYRTVLPSEIISEVGIMSKQRALPTQGLDYLQKSNLLKRFGFSPKVYSRKIYGDLVTKRLFHYYVESGIPFTISLKRHSIVCIGHVQTKKLSNEIDSGLIHKINDFKFIDSADYHNEYVIIDDNQYPYKLEEYDKFSIHEESHELEYFAVPLYKRIFLEAYAARSIFTTIIKLLFSSPKMVNIQNHWNEITGEIDQPIIERVFLTSSRKFKAFRLTTAANSIESSYYLNLQLPKFVWVMELTTAAYYDKNNDYVFGEIVLDATASKYSNYDSIIEIRIGQHLTYRLPDENKDVLFRRLNRKNGFTESFKQYKNNLLKGGCD